MKVFVGVSGGTDSAAALKLIKDSGFDAVAVHVLIHDSNTDRIERICKTVGAELLVVDMQKNFELKIRSHFIEQYLKGLTPNPCALCNRYIKFAAIYAEAQKHAEDFMISTGHYARIRHHDDGSFELLTGVDENKDQTYFLALLPKNILARCMFPLGDMHKEDVKELVQVQSIDAENRESQDVCFLKGTTVAGFIESNAHRQLPGRGDIVNETGEVVGTHDGFFRYTIGQRKGLDLGGMKERMYVVGIRPNENKVVVGPHDSLYSRQVSAKDMNWIAPVPTVGKLLYIKTRYRQQPIPARLVEANSDSVSFESERPMWAPTPGQVLAIYDGERLLGGGIISPPKQ